MARREGEEKNNWLLIKRSDKYAKPGKGDSILDKQDKSIKTGRAMEEIAGGTGKGGAKVWKSGRERKVAAPKKSGTAAAAPAVKRPAARRGPSGPRRVLRLTRSLRTSRSNSARLPMRSPRVISGCTRSSSTVTGCWR